MELRDLVVTPILLILLFFVSVIIKARIQDPILRIYFLPALWLKVFGALALGLIYQFYYSGGDTFNYHTLGSRVIWDALNENLETGVKLLFSEPGTHPELYLYAQKISFYFDDKSFFVVRIATFFDLITFSTYSSTAVLFSLVSFAGAWYFFITFYREFPHLHKWLAFAILFIPSVVFWGSGILKDTITLACLGFLTYSIHELIIKRNFKLSSLLLLIVSVWVIFSVKKYILICFIPAAFFWIYARQLFSIGSLVGRIIFIPIFIVLSIVTGYYGILKVVESDNQYSLDKIAKTAQITAYDIRYYTGKDAGSGYSLGELDGTFTGMLALAPKAVNVSLFRPYIWEVKNPLMLLSAIESFVFFAITFILLFRYPLAFFKAFTEPNILFCFVFSLVFAFGVGVSTYNFGTLVRYKIPLMPYYAIALILMVDHLYRRKKTNTVSNHEKSEVNNSLLDSTE